MARLIIITLWIKPINHKANREVADSFNTVLESKIDSFTEKPFDEDELNKLYELSGTLKYQYAVLPQSIERFYDIIKDVDKAFPNIKTEFETILIENAEERFQEVFKKIQEKNLKSDKRKELGFFTQFDDFLEHIEDFTFDQIENKIDIDRGDDDVLRFYFKTSEFNNDEISEIIALFSELYHSMSGDELEIVGASYSEQYETIEIQ